MAVRIYSRNASCTVLCYYDMKVEEDQHHSIDQKSFLTFQVNKDKCQQKHKSRQYLQTLDASSQSASCCIVGDAVLKQHRL